MNKSPVDILYIMGSGRSGSTLLGSVLGMHPSLVNAGEIYNYKYFFDTGETLSRKCSCGESLTKCEYWKEVRNRLVDYARDGLPDLKDQRPPVFAENNYRVLSAIRDVSGKKVIVDSSKRNYRLKLLLGSDLFRVHIVHLVRDGRAYGYSSYLTETKKGQGASVYYKKLSSWQKKNLAIKTIYGGRANYMFCRYEDFVSDPQKVVSEILEFAGLKDMSIEDAAGFGGGEEHQFSGNSGVIGKGELSINLDTRYLGRLTSGQWWFGTMLALPAIKIFKYPLRRRVAR